MQKLFSSKVSLPCLILFLLFSCGQAFASNVLFVVGDKLSVVDHAVRERLEIRGDNVTLRHDTEFRSFHTEGHDVVLISNSVDAAKLEGAVIRHHDENIVCLKSELFENLGLTGGMEGADYGYTEPRQGLSILKSRHPLAASLSGAIKVSNNPVAMAWGAPGQDSVCVASPTGDTSQCTVFAYEAGAVMQGQTAPARRVGFFLAGHNTNLTKSGWKLFDAAMEWAAQHEDDDFLSAKAGDVTVFMGWGSTAPDYTHDVTYQSSGAWDDPNSLPVINHEPSHYPHFTNGVITINGQTLKDQTFQANVATDFPHYKTDGGYINYIQGNPGITIYANLEQLKKAGFKGVRLYAPTPKVYIETILAASKLGMKVYMTVAIPDLENSLAGSVKAREQALYKTLTRQTSPGVPEGSVQCLHYVINVVGKSTFSKTVPLIFVGNESLVQSKTNKDPVYKDSNCSVPELRWGINLVRAVLAKELAGESLPAVTTPLVAGQIVQASNQVYPEVATLVKTIQKDSKAPIAYTVYPFQWGSRYFNTRDPYVNNPQCIANAFPPNSNWYDRCMSGGKQWTSGPPPIPSFHTVEEMVAAGNAGNILFSLKWMVDRVNWIWGGRKPGAKTLQIIAETGWPTAQPYQSGGGSTVTGNLQDATKFFNTIKDGKFKVENCPVMYFSSYDEPLKTPNASANMFSENHYGVYGWTGLPKFYTENYSNPLLRPFVILSIVPGNKPNGVPQMRRTDSSPAVAQYRCSMNKALSVDVPWYWGADHVSASNPATGICWIPNPDFLLSKGDTILLTTPGSKYSISLQNTDGKAVKFSKPADQQNTGSNLTSVDNDYGKSWKLWLSYPWVHGNNNDTNLWVYADWWTK
ncbi:MAG: hypothetical protein AB9866_11960 [Syntrophobacteraceae bacterium]